MRACMRVCVCVKEIFQNYVMLSFVIVFVGKCACVHSAEADLHHVNYAMKSFENH